MSLKSSKKVVLLWSCCKLNYKMNCVLVDDEKPALDLLEDNVRQFPYLNIVASCRKPAQVIEILQAHKVDLLFMDIHMPVISGLELIRRLKNPPMVILVTAHPDHALDGFELEVVDYLLKPVPFERFAKAVKKAYGHYQARAMGSGRTDQDYVFVNSNYQSVKIKKCEITYIEGLKDYIKIHLSEGKPVVTRSGLKDLDERLGLDRFMRIHKSYIVALDQIQSVQKTQLTVGGNEIPIGIGYRDLFHNLIQQKNL